MYFFSLILCLFFFCVSSNAQIVDGVGKCVISNQEDIEDVKEKALELARKDATSKSLGTEVNTINYLEQTGSITNLTSCISQNTYGTIYVIEKNYSITNKEVICEIKGIVVKNEYDTNISVNNFRNSYDNNENLTFNVTLYEEPGFLYVFYLDGNQGGEQLYPYYDNEHSVCLPKHSSWDFSLKRRDKYTPKKTGLVFIVLLKHTYSYKYDTVNIDNVLKWYQSIPNNYKNSFILKPFKKEDVGEKTKYFSNEYARCLST